MGTESFTRRQILALGGAALLAAGPASRLVAAPRRKPHPAPAGHAAPSALRDTVQAYMAANGTPGVAVIVHDAGADHFYPFGLARDANVPIQSNTVFGIGSVTKTFTCTLLADRVLDSTAGYTLDDPVLKHLPWLDGKPVHALKKVTLKMLATHTSGMPGEGADGHCLFQDQPPTPEMIQFWQQWVNSSGSPVGTHYSYSSIGMLTLGYAVAGANYNPMLQEAVCRPLGMAATAAQDFLPAGVPISQGHEDDAEGKTKTVSGFDSDLNSTPADMLRFIQAQLGIIGGATSLAQAVTLTHQKQFTQPGRAKIDLGLAWEIQRSTPTVYTKDGASSKGGCSCWIGVCPARQFGMMVLTNKDFDTKKFGPGVTSLGHALFTQMTGVALGRASSADA